VQLEGKQSGRVQKTLSVGERVTNFTETLGRSFDFWSCHVGVLLQIKNLSSDIVFILFILPSLKETQTKIFVITLMGIA